MKITNRAISQILLIPALIVSVYFLWGFSGYTAFLSFTKSQFMPNHTLVGWDQYVRLFNDEIWWVAYKNMFIFGGLYLFGCLILGLFIAVLLDQTRMSEWFYRIVILYPMAMSLIVTGLAWQWILNPTHGIEKIMRELGFATFEFRWLVDSEYAIYTILIAAIWHGIGLKMMLFLAGMKSINPEIWHSARVDGIPTYRVYWNVIIPQLRPAILTAVILLAFNVVRSFDVVVALTGGGPGSSSKVPAMYVYDYFFDRSRIGQGAAAAIVMVTSVLVVVAPYLVYETTRKVDK